MSQNYYSVSRVLALAKSTLEHNLVLQNIFILGEISNFTAHRSGHWYFSLKDDQSRVNCVMFAGNNAKVKILPKNGDEVLLSGNVTIFPSTGQLQLMVRSLEYQGLGQYYILFEQLKAKLAQEGLFAEERKAALPKYPFSIGIIVGDNSAAQADIRKTIAQRWPVASLFEYPSLVQGEGASEAIIGRLLQADQAGHDVLILARGGGSIEDLWAFNNEALAHVIYGLETPIVTGIGHEIDTTIADYAADLRCATPTAAAQAATPILQEVLAGIHLSKQRIKQQMNVRMAHYFNQLDSMRHRRVYQNPRSLMENSQLKLDLAEQRLVRFPERLQQTKEVLRNSIAVLGYKIDRTMNQSQHLINSTCHRMETAIQLSYQKVFYQFNQTVTRLDYLSPLKIMSKGYAFTMKNNQVIHSVHEIEIDDIVSIRYKDGKILSKVITKEAQDE